MANIWHRGNPAGPRRPQPPLCPGQQFTSVWGKGRMGILVQWYLSPVSQGKQRQKVQDPRPIVLVLVDPVHSQPPYSPLSPAPALPQSLLSADSQSSEKRRTGNCRALTSSGNRKAGDFLPTIAKACGTQRCCEHPCPGVTRQRPGQQGHHSPPSSQCKVRLGQVRSDLKA